MSLGCLGSYTLLERIGEGGMGVVYRAHDSRLDRQVAVKVLTEDHALDADYRARLLREARAEARLSHPNIAMCFDVGEARPEPADLFSPGGPGPHPASVLYLAMEFVPGVDLDAMIGARPLPLSRVLDLALQIASGLEAAHAAGVVHRDLKPGNVRVTPEGRAKILDFGLARHSTALNSDSGASTQSTSSRSHGSIVGTVLYMSPEQAAGQTADARSDLFSFGVVLYELVAGRRPFGGDDMVSAFYALANEQPAPLARYAGGVPEELERIVSKLLEKRPADRYQSAHEVLTDLQRLQAKQSSSTPDDRAPRRWYARPRAWLPMLGLAAVAAIALWMGGGPGRGTAFGSTSLAVLGFENATGDSSLAYLCSGLAADIEGELVQGGKLNVSSAAEVTSLSGDQRAPRPAARKLGVGTVLTGVLRRQGGTHRLHVELVDGRTGFVRWFKAFDLEPEEAFLVKSQITTAVATSLGAKRVEGAAPGSAAPTAAAYEQYLRGKQAINDVNDPLAPRRALAALDSAVSLAPGFALAWAARSRALVLCYSHERDSTLMSAAERSADRALAIDPELVAARIARARVYGATSRLPQAIADLDAVLRVNPSWDEGWRVLGNACRDSGNFVRAEASMRQAVALRPGYASNWRALANVLLWAGRYEEAREPFQRVIDLEPDRNSGYAGLASVEMFENRHREAVALYQMLPSSVTNADLATNIGNAYFFLRRLSEALPNYRLAVQLEPRNPLSRGNLGDCYLRMGRADSARTQFREAVRLDETALRVSPGSPELLAGHIMHLAKAGECSRAWTEYQHNRALSSQPSAEIQHYLAKAFAVCGRRAEAMAALRRMAALGAATDLLPSEDEFAAMRNDSDFRALIPAPRRDAPRSSAPRR